MNYIKKLYTGRINRKNYILGVYLFLPLLFSPFALIIMFLLSLLPLSNLSLELLIMIVLYTFCIVYLVLVFSLHVRRFHDLGNSGWRALFFLIPLVNIIILISLLASRGKDETNEYGEAPLKSIKSFSAILNWD